MQRVFFFVAGFWLMSSVALAQQPGAHFTQQAGPHGQAAADVVYTPIDLSELIASGKARVDSTKLDIGTAARVFDADPKTLARTPDINPAFVRIEFDEPRTVEHFRLYLIGEEHEFTITAADSLAALSDADKRLFTHSGRAGRGGQTDIHLDKALTARVFQLDVKRLTGDGYVHFFDWQFCEPSAISSLEVRAVHERALAHKPEELAEATGKLACPIDSVVIFRASAVADNGVRIAVDDQVVWDTPSGVVPFGDEPGQFLITTAGDHELTARYGTRMQRVVVMGTPREIVNSADDVEVWYIERLPRIDYDGPNGGWPAPGSEVTWRAHVYNWATRGVMVDYEWRLDGEVVGQGAAQLPPRSDTLESTHIDLRRAWEPSRRELTFSVTQHPPHDELITSNNMLAVFTDALAVGMWVERSVWDWHHEKQHLLPLRDSNSFAGWAQRHMRQWNEMLAAARYADAPDGGLDRVRLDRLVVVPDNALPLNHGLPSNNPDTRDKTVDMMWGFPTGPQLNTDWWSVDKATENIEAGKLEGAAFYLDLGLIHELGHARYLVDAYGFDVHAGERIQVRDEQGPILGRYMPAEGIVHWRKYTGNMGGDYTSYSLYEILMLNRVAGRRARGGNCNSPTVIGEFLQEIPERIVYAFTDQHGNPLAGADLYVYQARRHEPDWYGKAYAEPPDILTQTDERGRVSFDRTLFSKDGRIIHGWGHANSVVLMRITHAGRHYFLFEEVSDCNLAYVLGHTDEFTFPRQIELRSGEPAPEQWDARATWTPPGVGFRTTGLD